MAALAGLAFVVLYVAAFSLGIEVGDSDRKILAYYGDSSHRAKELVAFFLIAGAALASTVFVGAPRVRSRSRRCSPRLAGPAGSAAPWIEPKGRSTQVTWP